MKLLPKNIEKLLPAFYATEGDNNPIVKVKFFSPSSSQTWYAIEYDPGVRNFFGYVDFYGNGDGEFGYFSLDELEKIQLPFGLKIERDLYFEPKRIHDILSDVVG